MSVRKEYRRKQRTTVAAVRLDLDTEGFTYNKWDGTQRCKAGDWVVDSAGDVYTIDAAVFSRTYRKVGQGVYEKVANVWAEAATEGGAIQTKEGTTAYDPGDMLVFNDPDGEDGYAMSVERFASLYEAVDET